MKTVSSRIETAACRVATRYVQVLRANRALRQYTRGDGMCEMTGDWRPDECIDMPKPFPLCEYCAGRAELIAEQRRARRNLTRALQALVKEHGGLET